MHEISIVSSVSLSETMEDKGVFLHLSNLNSWHGIMHYPHKDILEKSVGFIKCYLLYCIMSQVEATCWKLRDFKAFWWPCENGDLRQEDGQRISCSKWLENKAPHIPSPSSSQQKSKKFKVHWFFLLDKDCLFFTNQSMTLQSLCVFRAQTETEGRSCSLCQLVQTWGLFSSHIGTFLALCPFHSFDLRVSRGSSQNRGMWEAILITFNLAYLNGVIYLDRERQ